MVFLDEGGAARHGQVVITPPPPDLCGLVEHVIVQTHPAGARTWRVVPDVSPHLIARVVDGPRGRRLLAFLVGARSTVAAVDVGSRVFTVGVRLAPGTLRALTSVAAVDFTDRAFRMDEVFATAVVRDLELSADAPPSLIAADLLRVVRRAARSKAPAPIAAAIARASKVRGLADALSTPERTTRNLAAREIGLAPKTSMRILRLHRALWLARSGRVAWNRVASEAGYADQAHLIRECRSLVGETPSQWMAHGAADSFKTGGLITR